VKKFAYILMDTHNDPASHKAEFDAKFVNISIYTVRNFEEAKKKVVNLWQEGYGAIELCGAFGRNRALELISLTKSEVAIGYVTNEPEQNDLIARFWRD